GAAAPSPCRPTRGAAAGPPRHTAPGFPSSNFGVPLEEARSLYARARTLPGLRPHGVDCHSGSQLPQLPPLARALRQVARLYRELRADGLGLEWLDVGGGLGVRYRDETPPSPGAWARPGREATAATGATVLI